MAGLQQVSRLVTGGLNANILDLCATPTALSIQQVLNRVRDYVLEETGEPRIADNELSNIIGSMLLYCGNFGTSQRIAVNFDRSYTINGHVHIMPIVDLLHLLTPMKRIHFCSYYANYMFQLAVQGNFVYQVGRSYGVIAPGVGTEVFLWTDRFINNAGERRMWERDFKPHFLRNYNSFIYDEVDFCDVKDIVGVFDTVNVIQESGISD